MATTTISSSITLTQTLVNGYTWPVTINGGTSGNQTVVTFGENLTFSNVNQYFIIGSQYVTIDGSSNTVTVTNVANYQGLVQNGTFNSNGYSNVTVQNIGVLTSGSTTLTLDGGYICIRYFGRGSTTNVLINNCYSTGTITNSSGGICGSTMCYNNGSVTISNCYSTGTIGPNGGGICGAAACQSNGSLIITNCYSTGTISSYAGGICGINACYDNGSVTISKCYSSGTISNYAGGICGNKFGLNTTKTVSITNCYSIGPISGTNSGGIVGSLVGYSDNASYTAIINITNCYSWGAITNSSGGICGGLAGSFIYSTTPTVTLTNCYSSGAVTSGDGLVSPNLQIANSVTKTNCYIANASWSDSAADASLNISGGAWTDVNLTNTSTPYRLSAFNQPLYDPSEVTSFSPYTSASGLISNGGTYSIISINGVVPSTYPNISINSSNGVITFNDAQSSSLIQVLQTQSNGSRYNVNSFTLNIINIPCFLKGTKILSEHGYKSIEDLRKGDKIKTTNNSHKKIEIIGFKEIYHQALEERIKEQLYKCSLDQYPELIEDLIITGCHSILVDSFIDEQQREDTIKINGDIFLTDDNYRLPACVDHRSCVFETPGKYIIYHLALENEDYYMNYGIYANGLLVETTSIRFMKELSNMNLIE